MYRFGFILLCYLIGAIPTSYLFVRIAQKKDIRQHGSGNSGATNAARMMGAWAFFTILCIDALKAYGALYLAYVYGGFSLEGLLVCAGALLIGNSFSPFLKFSGGKGVATGLGVISFMFSPLIACWYLVLFASALAIARRVDIASLTASAGGVGIVWFAGLPSICIGAALGFGCFIWLRHWSNIFRLLKGRS